MLRMHWWTDADTQLSIFLVSTWWWRTCLQRQNKLPSARTTCICMTIYKQSIQSCIHTHTCSSMLVHLCTLDRPGDPVQTWLRLQSQIWRDIHSQSFTRLPGCRKFSEFFTSFVLLWRVATIHESISIIELFMLSITSFAARCYTCSDLSICLCIKLMKTESGDQVVISLRFGLADTFSQLSWCKQNPTIR